ncbi:helix-turn-helix transcriptional regulator [Streptomyces spirodelae]|uniref:Helix-turn-helix transcriptional regulator n=1 Tax=Streptomyces spirodelae TaxID=2812904 RepID=A0ABS3WMU5_9ACTN|nr:helix-turn-helix transcriptional regulator [Streptomyces spirodelae]MBO8184436.1 helix-turn-helix transcriptional regulator [Streptomyces spirodelae]
MYEERASRLRGAVAWTRAPVPPGTTGRVLPDGCMDLLLWNGELVVAGPDTRAYPTTERRGLTVFGLRLPPGAGPRVFGVPAWELRDQRAPLADLWPGRQVRELRERIAQARDPLAALEDVAGRRLAAERRAATDPRDADRVDAVVAALRDGTGVAEVARRVGLSERQLHRRCRDAFGYGAKTLARVLRMQRALELAASGTPLAETALRAGYADQAHLARETRALAGVPMSELVRR